MPANCMHDVLYELLSIPRPCSHHGALTGKGTLRHVRRENDKGFKSTEFFALLTASYEILAGS